MTARLFESIPGPGQRLRCLACAHTCVIPNGKTGRCFVRRNVEGRLIVPHGEVSALSTDPVEKKPLYHYLPGEQTLSFGMEGCSFTCGFCQNWRISQRSAHENLPGRMTRCTADDMIESALDNQLKIITSTYNEPLVSSEWAAEIFALAKKNGLKTAFVSNGFASPEALDFLDPYVDAFNIDLKCFTEQNYQSLGGRLMPVLDTLNTLRDRGKWVEVTTLVVPGFNDSNGELEALANHLAQWNPSAPWHVSAYHESYTYHTTEPRTPTATVKRAMDMGKSAGLKFVYSGNLPPGQNQADTLCPACETVVVSRGNFSVTRNVLTRGACPTCGTVIPGIWK